jgi:hypothetical protein
MSAYFRLAIAVRSNLPATTKDEDGLACKILYILVTPVTVCEAELKQLTMNVRRTPKRILNAHPSDQRPQIRIDLGPASRRARFPAYGHKPRRSSQRSAPR